MNELYIPSDTFDLMYKTKKEAFLAVFLPTPNRIIYGIDIKLRSIVPSS